MQRIGVFINALALRVGAGKIEFGCGNGVREKAPYVWRALPIDARRSSDRHQHHCGSKTLGRVGLSKRLDAIQQ